LGAILIKVRLLVIICLAPIREDKRYDKDYQDQEDKIKVVGHVPQSQYFAFHSILLLGGLLMETNTVQPTISANKSQSGHMLFVQQAGCESFGVYLLGPGLGLP